jgi:hypothetical protein
MDADGSWTIKRRGRRPPRIGKPQEIVTAEVAVPMQ